MNARVRLDKNPDGGVWGMKFRWKNLLPLPQMAYFILKFDKIYDEIDQKFYNLVKSWINLRFWSPSFIDFWTDPANSDLMPVRLKEYLDLRFSILIWGNYGRN